MGNLPDRIRLIAIDLDGTLLNNAGQISAENRQAIQTALDRGLGIVLVSARPPFGMHAFVNTLGLEGFLIAYNGGLVMNASADHILRDCPMTQDDTRAAVDIIRRHDLYTGYYVGLEWYVEKQSEEMTWEGRALQRRAKIVDLRDSAPPQPHKLIVADLQDESRLARGYADMQRHLPHLNIHYSGQASFEVSDALASKAAALGFLAKHIAILPDEIMSIGNSDNDVDMLRFSGLAVAVENANHNVQSAADWVVKSNDAHGVAEAIYRCLSTTGQS